jgi:gliding motility-associated-like protein
LCHDTCAGWYRITLDGHDTLFSGLCEGTYYDTLIDADGCPVALTTHIRRNHALDSLRAWADDSLLWDGESTMLHATVSSSEAVGYLWSPAATLESPDAADAMATPTDSVTVYTVTATSGGCSRTAKVTVRCTPVVCGAPLFTIPNAFTPNGDGTNDAVCFNSEQIAEFTIAIFNRWGEAVYRSDDPTGCWDGTYRGTPCPAGVYTYTCHITCFGNHTNDMKGNITLIR